VFGTIHEFKLSPQHFFGAEYRITGTVRQDEDDDMVQHVDLRVEVPPISPLVFTELLEFLKWKAKEEEKAYKSKGKR
jgi:hypothetical protein